MRIVLKIMCLFIALVIAATVCGCGSGSGGGESYTINPDDFDMSAINGENNNSGDENTGNSDTNDNGANNGFQNTDNGNNSNNNKKDADNGGTDSGEQSGGQGYYYGGEDEDMFKPMQIPSRDKAYKLSNVFGKIKKGQAVKIAYFGGSVTSGTGASSDDKCWRSLTTAYIKTLSAGTVKEIKVSIGGTGSYLGAARFEHDIIGNNPDLVFIEFAINDVYSGITEDQSKANLEYMINRLYAKNPYADIVITLITNKSSFGNQYNSYLAHKAVADHYGIPIVDLGGEAYNKLEGSITGFIKNFEDSVHPNDSGHKLYADIMIAALKELFIEAPASAHKAPDSKLCENGYTSLTNIFASSINDKHWDRYSWFNNTVYEKTGSPLRTSYIKELYPNYLAPDNIGVTLTLNFTGNSFGFVGSLKENSSLQFTLDGSRTKTVSGTTDTGRVEYPVFTNLANTSHTITITAAGQNPYAAIAAFVATS